MNQTKKKRKKNIVLNEKYFGMWLYLFIHVHLNIHEYICKNKIIVFFI